MRRVILYLCLLHPALAQKNSPSATARAAAEELAQGKYPQFYARFTSQMKAALSEQTLVTTLAQQLFASVGAFEKIEEDLTCEAVQGMQACNVAFLFQQARVQFLLAIDAEGRVAGIRILGREPR